MWDEQFSVFAKKYHVIRYDLRGYGISSYQTEDYQFMHVEDLVTLMNSLHIKNCLLYTSKRVDGEESEIL